MPDEKLDQQVKELSEKLRKRDEAGRKKAEQDWRKAMERDTAGTTLGMFQLHQAQIASLQGQIDAVNPLAPVIRAITEIGTRLAALEAEVQKIVKGEVQ